MENPGARELVQVLQSMGVKFQGEYAIRECQRCKRHRRWKIGEVGHKRVMNLALCNACISQAHLATTNRSEVII